MSRSSTPTEALWKWGRVALRASCSSSSFRACLRVKTQSGKGRVTHDAYESLYKDKSASACVCA